MALNTMKKDTPGEFGNFLISIKQTVPNINGLASQKERKW